MARGTGCMVGCGNLSLPLVIPGERCSRSLCRRLLMSREPCLAGWGGWPSNMLTMSMRSILFKAAYKLSTAAKTRDKLHTSRHGKRDRGVVMSGGEKFTVVSVIRHPLLALFPSRVAHRLRSAELCSSSELGFSTRILLMSSTLSWNSRANSAQKMS